MEQGEGPSLYFAYGSNLDEADWSAFCRDHGFKAEALQPICPACLQGEMLVFDYRSKRRGCGALNIRAASGRHVDGHLFAVADEGWAALDHKEGHPNRYRREIVTVLDLNECRHQAWTYRVLPEHRVRFTPPNPAYLAVCRAGRERFGLSTADLDRAAAGITT